MFVLFAKTMNKTLFYFFSSLFLFIGETFVTRKISRAVAKIHLGQQNEVR